MRLALLPGVSSALDGALLDVLDQASAVDRGVTNQSLGLATVLVGTDHPDGVGTDHADLVADDGGEDLDLELGALNRAGPDLLLRGVTTGDGGEAGGLKSLTEVGGQEGAVEGFPVVVLHFGRPPYILILPQGDQDWKDFVQPFESFFQR